MIRPKKVGHVVLKARDLEPVEKFYTEVLGFEVVMRLKQPRGVFFTLGEQHHDLAVLEVPPGSDDPKMDQVGLHHCVAAGTSKRSKRDTELYSVMVFLLFEPWTTELRKASIFVIRRGIASNCTVTWEITALPAYANRASNPSWISRRSIWKPDGQNRRVQRTRP